MPAVSVPDAAPDFVRESRLNSLGRMPVAGIDEVGRGPLAGPVTAAAVVLDPDCIPEGLDDSQEAVPRAPARELAASASRLRRGRASAHADVAEIEALNILQGRRTSPWRGRSTRCRVGPARAGRRQLLPRGLAVPST